MALPTGTNVGPYVIDGFIDAGGMGEIYSATDTRLGRKVAIKVLPSALADREEYRRRFDREIKAISRVTHKNICTLYETGQHQGQPFIAMEYLRGRTLRDVLRSGPTPTELTLDVAVQVVSALDAAHREGIIHRDIKPSNIILNERGDTKVLDFGIAKALASGTAPRSGDDLTTEGSQIGTLAYMSPEQAAGRPVDVRSDLFSFGLVLYEMATGQLPYSGPPAAVLTQLVSSEPVTRPALLRPSIPNELDRIICRMLEKKPSLRYQTAGDLLAALRAFRRDLSADAVRGARIATVGGGSPARRVDEPAASFPGRSWLGRGAVGLAIIGAVWLAIGYSVASAPGALRTIAVFPCFDPLGDARLAYMCDLMAERIRANLRTVEDLMVTSPLQVGAVGGGQVSAVEVGRQLGVDGVLTAQLLGEGEERSVLIEVTDLRTGASLWSRAFEVEDGGEEPDFLNRVALSAAEGLALQLSATERERVRLTSLYIDAQYFAGGRTGADILRAIELYEEIIDSDPLFADAYGGLAMARVLTPYYLGTTPESAYPLAIEAANRAIELDARNAEAHAALGLANRDYRRDWEAARREFRRALDLDPGAATAMQWYAELLAGLSEFDEAVARIREARMARPLDLTVQAVEGWILLCAGALEEAEGALLATLEKDPESYLSNWFVGELRFAMGDYLSAIRSFEAAVEASGRTSRVVANLASAYALNGQEERARELLAELENLSTTVWVSGYEYAIVLSALGESEAAIGRLAEAIERNETWQIVNMGIDPMLEPIRSHPGFAQLMARAGLG